MKMINFFQLFFVRCEGEGQGGGQGYGGRRASGSRGRMIGMEFFMNRLTFQNFIIFDVEDWTTRDGELQNGASERLRW